MGRVLLERLCCNYYSGQQTQVFDTEAKRKLCSCALSIPCISQTPPLFSSLTPDYQHGSWSPVLIPTKYVQAHHNSAMVGDCGIYHFNVLWTTEWERQHIVLSFIPVALHIAQTQLYYLLKICNLSLRLPYLLDHSVPSTHSTLSWAK